MSPLFLPPCPFSSHSVSFLLLSPSSSLSSLPFILLSLGVVSFAPHPYPIHSLLLPFPAALCYTHSTTPSVPSWFAAHPSLTCTCIYSLCTHIQEHRPVTSIHHAAPGTWRSSTVTYVQHNDRLQQECEV